mmetsp:Transcript_329/g.1072  ORF Transcript_329/g.1072 Transcript_329/m.1072 type:complete len:142 (-) Transcript_329:2137-2562(-)
MHKPSALSLEKQQSPLTDEVASVETPGASGDSSTAPASEDPAASELVEEEEELVGLDAGEEVSEPTQASWPFSVFSKDDIRVDCCSCSHQHLLYRLAAAAAAATSRSVCLSLVHCRRKRRWKVVQRPPDPQTLSRCTPGAC